MTFIPIRIHIYFWLLAGLIGWLSTFSVVGTLIWMAVILVSVLFHEYGHALTATYFGQKVMISLEGFGGVTKRRGNNKLESWQEFLIVLNGPIAGFLLYFAARYLLDAYGKDMGSIVNYSLTVAVYINLFWTIINLFPVLPLDGGQLVKIILEKIFGFKGVQYTGLLSLILCVVIGLAGFAFGYVFAGVVFFMLAFENFQSWKTLQSMTDADRDQTLWEQMKLAENALKEGDFDRAWTSLDTVTQGAQKGMLYIKAIEHKAEILLLKQDFEGAYKIIHPVLSQLSDQFVPVAFKLAYRLGDLDQAIGLGQRAYQLNPNYEIAFVNALAHARKNEEKPAVGWLQRAQADGAPRFKELLEKNEFDSIRSSPPFQSLLKHL
jgi:stage IV sporulation protein FB